MSGERDGPTAQERLALATEAMLRLSSLAEAAAEHGLTESYTALKYAQRVVYEEMIRIR